MPAKLKCILLIDDDAATNYLNRMIIDAAAVAETVQVTLNGREALDYLTKSGRFAGSEAELPLPELILLDINMPVMDGWDFLDNYHLLPDSQKARIVLVMLTTTLNPDDEKRARKCPDVNGFRNKPLTELMLEEIMNTYFRG